ncbi:MAG TPA: hypothetical protein DDW52_11825 [Planctomycetaceae bacterium]|nr:hypothetical protein [Planctomycetaceae bacterium]
MQDSTEETADGFPPRPSQKPILRYYRTGPAPDRLRIVLGLGFAVFIAGLVALFVLHEESPLRIEGRPQNKIEILR